MPVCAGALPSGDDATREATNLVLESADASLGGLFGDWERPAVVVNEAQSGRLRLNGAHDPVEAERGTGCDRRR